MTPEGLAPIERISEVLPPRVLVIQCRVVIGQWRGKNRYAPGFYLRRTMPRTLHAQERSRTSEQRAWPTVEQLKADAFWVQLNDDINGLYEEQQ
jgi:hypothetical protein